MGLGKGLGKGGERMRVVLPGVGVVGHDVGCYIPLRGRGQRRRGDSVGSEKQAQGLWPEEGVVCELPGMGLLRKAVFVRGRA